MKRIAAAAWQTLYSVFRISSQMPMYAGDLPLPVTIP